MLRNRPNLGSQIWGNSNPPIWDVQSFSSTSIFCAHIYTSNKFFAQPWPPFELHHHNNQKKTEKQKQRNPDSSFVLYKNKLHQRLHADPSWYCTDQIGHQCWGILIDNIAVSGRCTQVEPQNHLPARWVEKQKRWRPTTLRGSVCLKKREMQ